MWFWGRFGGQHVVAAFLVVNVARQLGINIALRVALGIIGTTTLFVLLLGWA